VSGETFSAAAIWRKDVRAFLVKASIIKRSILSNWSPPETRVDQNFQDTTNFINPYASSYLPNHGMPLMTSLTSLSIRHFHNRKRKYAVSAHCLAQKATSGIFLRNCIISSMWEKSARIPKLPTQSQPKLLGFSRTVVPCNSSFFNFFESFTDSIDRNVTGFSDHGKTSSSVFL